jgi:hypothetical protein
MTSLVEELQKDALNPGCSVSHLLRQAKVVASKLDLQEFLVWTQNELNGYLDAEPPSYREVTGRVRVWNPYRGWLPLQFPNPDMERKCSTRVISQKVAELEELAKKNSTELQVPFSPEIAQLIRNSMNYPLEPTLAIAGTAVDGILDAVRNIILDWSLTLEKTGITGEGMSFSKEDKSRAHDASVIYQIDRIENFTGNMGSVSDQAVVNASSNVGVDAAGLTRLIEQIRKHQSEFELSTGNQAKLDEKLAAIEAEITSPKPEPSRIGALLGSLRAVIQSAATNLVVHGALFEIDKYKHLIPFS